LYANDNAAVTADNNNPDTGGITATGFQEFNDVKFGKYVGVRKHSGTVYFNELRIY